MLRKIAIEGLRVGMFLDRIEGSWTKHGLWRSKFLLRNAAHLQSVIESGARECWIDTAKGLDVVEPAAEPSPTVAPTPLAPSVRAVEVVGTCAGNESVSMQDELATAARICAGTRATVAAIFDDIRRGASPDVQAARPIVEEVLASVHRNRSALLSLVRLRAADDYTYMHSVSVCALMVAIGRELGLDDVQCCEAGLGGLLHDVGKALTPLEILNKPGKLSDPEFAEMREHAARGHAVLLAAGVVDATALDVCRHHHEKVDGSGYPDRLKGEAISLMARMGAVCDIYDAVTADRPYKKAWDPAVALAEMASWAGHLDRTVLAALIKVLGIYPTGSLVRLASGKLAVVIENCPSNLRAPVVRVFYSTKSSEPIPAHLLDLGSPRTRDRITASEPREKWAFPQLNELAALPY